MNTRVSDLLDRELQRRFPKQFSDSCREDAKNSYRKISSSDNGYITGWQMIKVVFIISVLIALVVKF